MAKNSIVVGTSSYICELFFQDSGSIIGAGKTGILPSSMTATYKRNTASSHVLFNLTTGALGSYVASGFNEVSNTQMPGLYEFGVPNASLTGNLQSVVFMFTGAGFAPLPFELELTQINNQDSGTFGVSNLQSVYHADIQYIRDSSQDEYTVTWFKNGQRILAGITNPYMTVVNRADGANLFANSGMTEIGSTHSFKYDALDGRQTSGNTYLVITSGTIDSSVRNYSWLLGRDQ